MRFVFNSYFDVLGLFVVAYSFKVAKVLHCVPLALTLAAIAATKLGSRGSRAPLIQGAATFALSCVSAMVTPFLFFAATALFVQVGFSHSL